RLKMPKQTIEMYDAKWRQIFAEESAECFESRYPNLLACFDVGRVFNAIGNVLKIDGLPDFVREDYSIETIVKATEEAFLALLKRGALDGFIRVTPLPEAAQKELDSMAGIAPVEVDPEVEQRNSQRAALDEVVSDYRKLDSR